MSRCGKLFLGFGVLGWLASCFMGFMLWIIAAILFILWALGYGVGYTLNGLIHILLVIAIIVVLIRVIQGL